METSAPRCATIPAIVMAAGGPDDPLCREVGGASRALVPVAGVPMVVRAVAAMQAAAEIGPVIVTHRPEHLALFEALSWPGEPPQLVPVPEPVGHVSSILAGAAASPQAPYVLVAPCDLPLMTPESIGDFTRQALASGADLCYAVVRYERCLEQFPGTARTFLRLRDGRFTGGNIVLARPAFLQEHSDRIEAAFHLRKRPLQMLRWFGPLFILRFALGKCTLAEVARGAERMLGCRAQVVPSDYPEIGFDVDKLSDLREAERVLQTR